MSVCQVCGGKACPADVCALPVMVGDEVVLKGAILCGKCNRLLEEEVQKQVPIKKAEIVAGFLKVRGVKVQELEDYERYIK